MTIVKKKAVTKKITTKKTSVKKAPVKRVAKNVALGTSKLHVVLGDPLMLNFVQKCETIGMSKSEVGRLLIDAFSNGTIKITVPKVSQTKAIRK